MKAIVFLRTNSRKLNIEHGHVGWAFEVKPGIYQAGSVEDIEFSKRWVEETKDPFSMFAFGPKNYPYYDVYKIIEVPNANIDAAIKAQKDVMSKDYWFVTNNCMDATYKVLSAYGVTLQKPSENWLPNSWFRQISGAMKILFNTSHNIDFTLYEHPNCDGDSEKFTSNTEISDADIHLWGREIGDCVSCVVLRKGNLRLFEHQNFGGRYVDLTQTGMYNLKDCNFEDIASSFKAWA